MSGDGSILTSHLGVKVISSVLLAGAIDRFYFNELDMKHNAIWALSVSGGIAVGSMIGSTIPDMLPKSTFYNGKTIAQRSFELLFSSASAYGAFKISGSDYNPSEMGKRLGSILVVDFLSEYAGDYFLSQPLAYLQ